MTELESIASDPTHELTRFTAIELRTGRRNVGELALTALVLAAGLAALTIVIMAAGCVLA